MEDPCDRPLGGGDPELVERLNRLSIPELRDELPKVWSSLRAPGARYGRADFLALFERAGFLSDVLAGPPSEPTYVYRGELACSPVPGLSWTTDERVAASYFTQYQNAGRTIFLQLKAPPECVRAVFSFESEWVVNPDGLDVHVVDWRPFFENPIQPFQPGWNEFRLPSRGR